MRVWEAVEDDCACHWVIASDMNRAMVICKDFNWSDEINSVAVNLVISPLEGNIYLTFTLDQFKIKHTCDEWLAIYNHQEKYLGSNEF